MNFFYLLFLKKFDHCFFKSIFEKAEIHQTLSGYGRGLAPCDGKIPPFGGGYLTKLHT